MKLKEKSWIFLIIILVILDQVFKNIVRTYLTYQEEISIIKGFFSITYVENQGGAFSILKGIPILFVLVSIGVVCFLLFYCTFKEIPLKIKYILSLIISGTLGNFFDRALFGTVTDYLAFQFGFYHFPIFNFADILIVLGVFILLILELRRSQNER